MAVAYFYVGYRADKTGSLVYSPFITAQPPAIFGDSEFGSARASPGVSNHAQKHPATSLSEVP
jgi:hypothetical protein